MSNVTKKHLLFTVSSANRTYAWSATRPSTTKGPALLINDSKCPTRHSLAASRPSQNDWNALIPDRTKNTTRPRADSKTGGWPEALASALEIATRAVPGRPALEAESEEVTRAQLPKVEAIAQLLTQLALALLVSHPSATSLKKVKPFRKN